MNKKNNRKGFTIVELVIVIAVIAILATVLVPTFSGIVERANTSALTQELRNAYTNYVIIAAEDGEYAVNVIIEHETKFYIVESGVPNTEAFDSAEEAAEEMGVAAGAAYAVFNGTTVDSSATVPTAAPAGDGQG